MTKVKGEPKVYKIGKVVLPGNFQTGILMRFMSDASMKSLFDDYNAAKLHEHGAKEPSEEQFAIARMYKKTRDRKKVIKKFNVPDHRVDSAIRKVAVWDYLNA